MNSTDEKKRPGKYDVVDPAWRGYDPQAPQRVVRPENRKRVTPGSDIGSLDPDAGDRFWGI